MNRLALFAIVITFMVSCLGSFERLLDGEYQIGDIAFQESLPINKQIELINSMHDIVIEDNIIRVNADSIYKYSLRGGLLTLKNGKKTYKLECENFSTDQRTVYKLFLDTEYVKSITIMERNK